MMMDLLRSWTLAEALYMSSKPSDTSISTFAGSFVYTRPIDQPLVSVCPPVCPELQLSCSEVYGISISRILTVWREKCGVI